MSFVGEHWRSGMLFCRAILKPQESNMLPCLKRFSLFGGLPLSESQEDALPQKRFAGAHAESRNAVNLIPLYFVCLG